MDYHRAADLLCVLLKQAELEALVQLELADVPGLVEVLSGGVQFVQQLGDPRHQALGVGVTHPVAATTAGAAAAVAVGEGLAALDSLEQPGDGLDVLSRKLVIWSSCSEKPCRVCMDRTLGQL